MAKEATTPDPEKKGETTPPEGSEAITSGKEPEKGKPAPPSPEGKKSVEQLEAEVGRLQGELDKANREKEQAQRLQSQADRKRQVAEKKEKDLSEMLDKIRNGEISIDEISKPAENPPEAAAQREVKIEVQNLILDNPEYQAVLNKDITLKEILRKNPSALLDNFFDVQDAVEQIKDLLDKKVSSAKEETPSQPAAGNEGEGNPPEFEPGAIQPKSDVTPEKPSTSFQPQTPDEKLEEGIKSKLKFEG